MDALEELKARIQIAEVKARYCRFLDTKEWEGFGGLFTAEATLDVSQETGAPPHHGRNGIVDIVSNVVQHARTAHHVHSPEIVFTGPDTAEVIWAMQDRVVWEADHSPVPNAAALTGWGHYHERYVRQNGTWLIAACKLTRLNVEFQP
jgi:hypothetical protein